MIFRSAVSVRARLVVAALAVCSLALAGCQGGDTPDSSGKTTTTTAAPTSSATPTPTPTPSGVYKPADATGKAQNVPVPVKPALADENTKEGLEAFTKYWFELLSYGYETGDVAPVRDLSGPNCVFCSGLRDSIATAWEDGRWIAGGRIQTPSTAAKFTDGAGSQQVTIQVIHDIVEIRTADGDLHQVATKGSNRASQAVAAYTDGRWTIVDLGLIK